MSNEEFTPTAGQTVGPFFHYGMIFPLSEQVSAPSHPETIRLFGTVYDGAGDPIPDAQVEIWQAAGDGDIPRVTGSLDRYGNTFTGQHRLPRQGHTFTGFGRAATDRDGSYEFLTRNPGNFNNPQNPDTAPFISAIVFARGLLNKLHTRIYLPDDSEALARDPFLASLTEAERKTLVATRTEDGDLHHDVWLQGEKETVFLEFRK